MKKRILSALLAAMIVASASAAVVPVAFDADITVSAATAVSDFSYSVKDGVATITAYDGTETEIEIPGYINSMPVVIGNSAFRNKDFTSVVIGEGVTEIEASAFYSCKKLTSITFPSTLKKIGASALGYCSAMKTLSFPSNLEEIGNYAFRGLSSLEGDIVIPASVKSVGSFAFGNCDKLNGVEFKSDDTAMSNDLFYCCTNLKSVRLPANAESIPNDLFYLCSSLESITIPSNVTTIGSSAFNSCKALTSIVIPSKVTSFGNSCFSGCSALKSINIPENVTLLSDSLFYGCSALTYMPIHDKVTTIGTSAFSNSGITSLNIPDSVETIKSNAFYSCNSLTQATIPSTVKIVGDNVFMYCAGIKNVVLKSSETTYGTGLLRYCTAVESVTLPSGIKKIPGYFFYGCTALENVTIPSSVETIENNVFQNTAIKTLKLPSGLTSIGASCFSGCKNLTVMNFPSGITSYPNNLFQNCTSLTEIPINDNITQFGSNVFSGCTGLNAVTVPETVTKIGTSCFDSCSSLLSLTIPSNLTEIPNSLCYNCKALVIVNIPSGVKTIGSNAFSGCVSLKSLTLPNGLETINSGAFNSMKAMDSITIPETVTTIGDSAFAYSGLTSITIPASVTSMGTYLFNNCDSLTKVELKNPIEKLPIGTFYYCDSMYEYEIPEGVKEVGNYAFYGNKLLKDIYFPSTIEKIGTTGNFQNYADITMYGYEGTVVKEIAESKGYHYADRTAGITSLKDTATGIIVKGNFEKGTALKVTELKDQYFEYPSNTEIIPDMCYEIKLVKNGNVIAPVSDMMVYVPAQYEKSDKLKVMTMDLDAETGAESTFNYANGYIRVVMAKSGIFAAQDYNNLKLLVSMDRNIINTDHGASISAKLAGNYGSNYRYSMLTRLSGTEEWTTQTNYSTTNSWTFAPGEKGVYDILIKGKDGWNKEVEQLLTLKVNNFVVNKSSIENKDITLGESFVFKAKAEEGTEEYQYSYKYFPVDENGNVGEEVELANYITADTYKFKPTKTGKYKLRILTTDAVYGGGIAKTFNAEVHEALKNNSSVKGTPVVNTDVTISGSGSGGVGALTYTYYYKKASSASWVRIGNADTTDKTAVFNPGSAAKYDVKVVVKDSQGRTLDKVISVNVLKEVSNLSTLGVSKASAGDTVTINGMADGGLGVYTYTYYYKKSTSSAWTKIGTANTTSAKAEFVPSSAADYKVKVVVTDKSGLSAEKIIKISVNKALSNRSTVSSTSVPQNTNVIVTGAAADGAGGYKYAFYYKKSTSAAWQSIGEIYGNTKSVSFVPATVAKYLVKVNVKDANGKVVTKQFTVNSTKPSGTDLVNQSKVSKMTVVRNNPITITGAASGGSGGYKYAFYYKKADSKAFTAIGTEYGSASNATFTPASSGKYSVRINVMDSKGTIVTKQYTIVSEPAKS